MKYAKNIADYFIEQMEKGTAPWQRTWKEGELIVPYNAVSGTQYKGSNLLVLTSKYAEFTDPRWVTFLQAKKMDWKVMKGSKATTISFAKFDDVKTSKDKITGEEKKVRVKLDRPVYKCFNVFNAEQIEGIPPLDTGIVDEQKITGIRREAQTLIDKSGARIIHDGSPPRYNSLKDIIFMPQKDQFGTPDEYYSTCMHELGHWTGHEKRLNRKLGNAFGSPEYAKEELRAEIASYMLGVETGIAVNPENNTAYLKNWIQALKEDPMEIFKAASDAEKIKKFLINGPPLEQQKSLTTGMTKKREPLSVGL